MTMEIAMNETIIQNIVAALASAGHRVKVTKDEHSFGGSYKATFADKAQVGVDLRERGAKTTVFVGGYGIKSRKHFPQPKAGHRWADIAACVVHCAEDDRVAKANNKADAAADAVVDALYEELGVAGFLISTDGKGLLTLELRKTAATPDQIRMVVLAAIACGLMAPRQAHDE
jgi:hypothetical protein